MRLNNWQSKLGALITERMHAPFAWGSQDCVLLGADVKLAVTGEDPAAAWRGTYKDALGAARVLAALGGMEGLAAKFLGEAVPVAMAQPADVGLLPTDEGRECFAVCMGDRWLVPGENGLIWVDSCQLKKAWRLEPSNQG